MLTDYTLQIKSALNQGAYSTAFNIGSCIKPEDDSYKESWLLTLLAQIGMTDLKDINESQIVSDLSYASKVFFSSFEDVNGFETTVFEYLSICTGTAFRAGHRSGHTDRHYSDTWLPPPSVRFQCRPADPQHG